MFYVSQGQYEDKPSPFLMLDRVKMYSVMVLQVQSLWQKKGTSLLFLYVNHITITVYS